MQTPTLKYLYFETENSTYRHSFKIHRYMKSSYFSLKANESQIKYTQLFPGNEMEESVVAVSKKVFFQVGDTALLDALYELRLKKIKILFTYTEENTKMQLINFTCVENKAEIISNSDVQIFPKELPPFVWPDWLLDGLKAENIDLSNMGC